MAQRNATYFLSDCHLGANYIADPRRHEATIVAWLRSIAADARELYLLGDIIDYWFEYRYVVPRGYTRFFGALAELADAGVAITWIKGNHDIWLFDYLRDEIGLTVADGVITRTIDRHLFILGHGDSVDSGSAFYRLMRSMFRCRFLQWLYAGIHPRWTVGFAHGWSASNRMRHPDAAPELAAPHRAAALPLAAPLPDNDGYVRFAREFLATVAPEVPRPVYFVMGHRHFLLDQSIDGGAGRLIVLGESYSMMTYGRYAEGEFQLLKMGQNDNPKG